MTGEEFTAIRKGMGVTQAVAAAHLGVSTRTLQGVEAADDVPAIYGLAIERLSLNVAATRQNPALAARSIRDEAHLISTTNAVTPAQIRRAIDDALARIGS